MRDENERKPVWPRRSKRRTKSASARRSAARRETTTKAALTARRSARLLSQTTTDHDEIPRSAEARGGHPATVKRTTRDDQAGVLRTDFPGYSGSESLKEISWEEFFDKFDESNLALIYQEKTAGGKLSNFNKRVKRD